MFFKAPPLRSKALRRLRKYFPNWAKMLEYDARQISDGVDEATGVWNDDRAIVICGGLSFFLKSPLVRQEPKVWDFAVFGLAAISMYTNRTIRFDKPVSASAARAIEKLNYIYRVWSLVSISQPRLELANIVPDPVNFTPTLGKIICLSGGIDSTSAAICAKAETAYTHGLLIAGADYPSADHAGFIELEKRVKANAKIIGLDVIVVETDFRKMPMDWGLQHSFLLAMALHYHSASFEEASYSIDSMPAHELIQHPWGNCSALLHAFSTDYLPFVTYGHLFSRSERARIIADFDNALLPQISVCWVDTSTGQNCGRCMKCQRTRAVFNLIGADTTTMFVNDPGPLRVDDFKIPENYKARMDASVVATWLEVTEKESGDYTLLKEHLVDLRRSYVRQMPYR